MPTRDSSPIASRVNLHEPLLDLAWSLWSELGIPGWNRAHQDWAIDPEPLLLFTALLGDSDPRLRDECMGWCVRNGRYIAASRLRNLLTTASPAVREQWGPFAASVNVHADTNWPGATEPLSSRPSSKEGLDDFKRPALISLRLRTTFGVGARSEILLYFASRPDARAVASDLSEVVHYTKRNVEKELEALRKAGRLSVEKRHNRLEHFLEMPESLLMFAAPRPKYFPRWDAIFPVLGALLNYENQARTMDSMVALVEARRLLGDIQNHLRQSGLPAPPSTVPDRVLVSSLRNWAVDVTGALARADAGGLGWAGVESPLEWAYLPMLGQKERNPIVLHTELARDPGFFMDVLRMTFRARDEEPQQLSSEQRTNASIGYRLLESWKRPPGTRDDGTIDETALNMWVDQARSLADQQNRQAITDQHIGSVLRHVPDDLDGLWPNRIVRDLIEQSRSDHLEKGLEIGLHNSRGATWRGLTDGGAQERTLQTRYLGYAQKTIAEWPRTAAMLRRIARTYAEQARRQDEEAEITEDRWR